MGYPGIGGGTVIITKGIVSGKVAKYDKSWIKTDAIVSYGVSGGAAIDAFGKLIGIPTQAHSDFLGSLGYIINITSLNDWIEKTKTKESGFAFSSAANELMALMRMQDDAKKKNTFINERPGYSIEKLDSWKFFYPAQDTLFIQKPDSNTAGELLIMVLPTPYVVSGNTILPYFKRIITESGSLTLTTFQIQEKKISGQPAFLVTQSALGVQETFYVIPHGMYFLVISYDYGENEADKAEIDSMLQTLKLLNTKTSFAEVHGTLTHPPKIIIESLPHWPMMNKFDPEEPVEMWNKDMPDAFIFVTVEKMSAKTRDVSNEQFLENTLLSVKEVNQVSKIIDAQIDVVSKNAHSVMSNAIRDAVMVEYTLKKMTEDRIILQGKEYYLRTPDYIITISLFVYNDSKSQYDKAVLDFTAISQTLDISRNMYERIKGKIILRVGQDGQAYYVHPTNGTRYYLGRPEDAFALMRKQGIGITNKDLAKIPIAAENLSGEDADADGLPDLFEGAVGTDAHNKDSDGDGYSDTMEIQNGYNPLGSGRLEIDIEFAQKQKGKIFLQVESAGEAWFVNPSNNKRYFLGRPSDSFTIMRSVGLGISEKDYATLSHETFSD